MAGPHTYLSPRVKHIICEVEEPGGEPNHLPPVTGTKHVYKYVIEGRFNWEYVEDKYREIGELEDTFEYFENAVRHLSQCFLEAELYLGRLSTDMFKEKYCKSLQWTSAPDVLWRSFDALQQNVMDTGVIHSLLLSTALLERSLGNVYLMKGTKCPSMLKDLLLTRELECVFGSTIIKFLRLIVGPPTSLNIRNLTWHGFPLPGEIPKRYAYAMLMLFTSLGHHLMDHKIEHEKIPKREFVLFSQASRLTPDLRCSEWSKLSELGKDCQYVPDGMLPIWHIAIASHSNERYGEAVSLILPQLEHLLRCVFAAVNRCPDRVLTAENTTLFTTFDEMLERELPDGTENRIREALGDNIMDLVSDVLIYPGGPRVRDMVSHGETDLVHFPKELTEQIFLLCTAVCLRFIQPTLKLLKNDSLLALGEIASRHQSVFHPIAISKDLLRSATQSLEDWQNIRSLTNEMGSSLEDLPVPDEGNVPCAGEPIHEATIQILDRYFPKQEYLVRCIEPYGSISREVNTVLTKPISTIYRWKEARSSVLPTEQQTNKKHTRGSESELVGTLSRISTGLNLASEQIIDLFRCRCDQWKNKELRSRQRNNFVKMIKSLPTLSTALRLLALIVAGLVMSLDDPTINSDVERSKNIKLLRYILQYVENLITFTRPTENKWEVAVEKTNELITRIMKS